MTLEESKQVNLTGLVIPATFSLKQNQDADTTEGCQAEFDMAGLTLHDLLFGFVKSSAVIKLQNPARKLTLAEIKATFVDQVHRVLLADCGKKIESPAAQKAKKKSAVKSFTDAEYKEMGFTAEMIQLVRDS